MFGVIFAVFLPLLPPPKLFGNVLLYEQCVVNYAQKVICPQIATITQGTFLNFLGQKSQESTEYY